MTPDPLTVLLRGALDYAGMFPPAQRGAPEAVASYAAYRAGPHAWMLGTFVVSARALDEVLSSMPDNDRWPLSIVFSGSPSDLARALTAAEASRKVLSTAIEFAPVPAEDVRSWAERLPPSTAAFFEVPPDAEMGGRLEAIAAAGAFAKLRTGGVTRGAFPRAIDIVRFLQACSDRGIACKATAGLHHALHGTYPLTYDAQSEVADMNGFLNMLLLAAVVRAGVTERDALDLLGDRRADALRFNDSGVEWGGRTISTADLARARRELCRSFGSCSFEEPVADLHAMGLL